jgi:hypothetical protein
MSFTEIIWFFIKIIAIFYNIVLFLFFPEEVEIWLIQIYGFVFIAVLIDETVKFYKDNLIIKLKK